MTGDQKWLQEAIDLSRRCPVVTTAYAVGAIIVGSDGIEVSRGYARETDVKVHAEESALAKLPVSAADLSDATIYSTLEPCSVRRSRPLTCSQLIIDSGIKRVVMALREPPLFADCHGVELFVEAGIEVVEMPALARLVWEINAHVLGDYRDR